MADGEWTGAEDGGMRVEGIELTAGFHRRTYLSMGWDAKSIHHIGLLVRGPAVTHGVKGQGGMGLDAL